MQLRNIFWNIAGLSAPAVCAAITIPQILNMIGIERFGILTLAWGLIAFSGIFDLGIGRATTQYISRLRGSDKSDDIPRVIAIAEKLSLCSGLLGTCALLIAAIYGAHHTLNYNIALETEVTLSVYVLAFVVPIQTLSAVYRGTNEAYESFRSINIIRIGLGVATFVGPYIAAQFSANLGNIVSTLLASRLLALLFFRYSAKKCILREYKRSFGLFQLSKSRDIAKQLFVFGGWLTVSSVLHPIMMQADRFIISSTISTTAVAGYTIPYEIIVQSLVLIGAITTVAFPRLTVLVHANSPEANKLFYRWLVYSVVLMSIISVIFVLYIPVILRTWIGSAATSDSISVGQILALGLVPYTIGTMYVAMLHAHGRPSVTGKAHLFEAPAYLILLFTMVRDFGLEGAAWAWNIRLVVDTLVLVISFEYKTKSARDVR